MGVGVWARKGRRGEGLKGEGERGGGIVEGRGVYGELGMIN